MVVLVVERSFFKLKMLLCRRDMLMGNLQNHFDAQVIMWVGSWRRKWRFVHLISYPLRNPPLIEFNMRALRLDVMMGMGYINNGGLLDLLTRHFNRTNIVVLYTMWDLRASCLFLEQRIVDFEWDVVSWGISSYPLSIDEESWACERLWRRSRLWKGSDCYDLYRDRQLM